MQIYADDVHRLLAAVTTDRAFVFASSGGAAISLELAARHPEQIAVLVAHETPAAAVLPDPPARRSEMEDVVQTYRSAGIGPAMQKFMTYTRIGGGPRPAQPGEPTPEQREGMAMMQRNMEFWLGHSFRAIADYEPDFATLNRSPVRIVSGVGDESRGELAHEGGMNLAARLGSKAVVFPGAHGGYDSHAAEFAVKLRQVLEGP